MLVIAGFEPAERGNIRARRTVRMPRRPESRRSGRLESLRYDRSADAVRVGQTFQSAVSQVLNLRSVEIFERAGRFGCLADRKVGDPADWKVCATSEVRTPSG